MDLQINYETIGRRPWKAKDWPQLVFYPPLIELHRKGSKYDQVVSIGNSNPEILLPYAIEQKALYLPGHKYTISFIRNNESKTWLREMELIDLQGNKIFFEELMYAETRRDFYRIRIPFFSPTSYYLSEP